MESKGHFCYGCNDYFHENNPCVVEHKDCKGNKSLGICVDKMEFGEYYIGNLVDKTKYQLIEIIEKLLKEK
jgi:hypothetical protein